MKIAVVPNFSKVNTPVVTGKVIAFLLSQNAEIYLDKAMKKNFSKDIAEHCSFFSYEEMLKSCDAVIAVGGDGTMIHCAAAAGQFDKPILGINTGRLGYVAELEPNELSLLSKLVTGDYVIEKRMMLRVTVEKSGEVLFSCDALNDAVLSSGSLSKLIDFEVFFSENSICKYRADGLIFSTPTGSTAYSLSAGGPIVDPSLECILLVPVCPHALAARPGIFDQSAYLRVLAESAEREVYLTVDGEKSFPITPGCSLTVQRSEVSAKLIKLKKRDFYSVLNEKL